MFQLMEYASKWVNIMFRKLLREQRLFNQRARREEPLDTWKLPPAPPGKKSVYISYVSEAEYHVLQEDEEKNAYLTEEEIAFCNRVQKEWNNIQIILERAHDEGIDIMEQRRRKIMGV